VTGASDVVTGVAVVVAGTTVFMFDNSQKVPVKPFGHKHVEKIVQ